MKTRILKTATGIGMACAALLFCFALVGCSQDSSQAPPQPSSNDSSSEKPESQSPAAPSQDSSPKEDEQPEQAPITVTAYFQETSIGESNVVAFIVREQEDKIVGMTVKIGYVNVTGNTTTKKNFGTSTATVTDPNPQAFKVTYGNSGGAVAGSVSSTGLVGTINVPGLGEFPVNAPPVEMTTCPSCKGFGVDFGSSVGSTGRSKSCEKCSGLGSYIEYKGTNL